MRALSGDCGETRDSMARRETIQKTIQKTLRRPATTPAPLRDRRKERVVRVATVRNQPMADLTRQVLAEAGIQALLKPVGPGYGGWGVATTLMHDVLVLEGDVERARVILADLDSGADGPLPGEG